MMQPIKKLIFAPDSFKGTMSAQDVCSILTDSALRHLPGVETHSIPISDGGEGLTAVLKERLGGQFITIPVKDPLGRTVEASYLLLPNKTAVVEMAAASGLFLLTEEERNVLTASTFGTGQLIDHALDNGIKNLIIGLGGSATNDGGAGAAMALGLRLCRTDSSEIPLGNYGLYELNKVDASSFQKKFKDVSISIACDVDNPLCGPMGASAVYGPQKGATPEQVEILDNALNRFSQLLAEDSGNNFSHLPGCGAAGGFALPFLTYTGAKLSSGIDVVLDTIGFDQYLTDCSLLITGEGRTDAQSAMGKAISGVSRRAAKMDVPVVVLSGALAPDAESLYDCGVNAMFSACPGPMSLEDALDRAEANYRWAADNLFRFIARMIV